MDFQRILQRWNRFAEPRRLLLDSLLAAGASLVQCRNADEATLPRREATERTTRRLP